MFTSNLNSFLLAFRRGFSSWWLWPDGGRIFLDWTVQTCSFELNRFQVLSLLANDPPKCAVLQCSICFAFRVCTASQLISKNWSDVKTTLWDMLKIYILFVCLHPSWDESKIFWILWEKANNSFTHSWTLFLPSLFPEQPGVKLPLLSSVTSTWVSIWSCWTPKLLKHSLSFRVGFLHLFSVCLQYILVSRKMYFSMYFWIAKDALHFFYVSWPKAVRVVTFSMGNIQRHEMRELTHCQRTTVI